MAFTGTVIYRVHTAVVKTRDLLWLIQKIPHLK